jgi:hypothetical protein
MTPAGGVRDGKGRNWFDRGWLAAEETDESGVAVGFVVGRISLFSLQIDRISRKVGCV